MQDLQPPTTYGLPGSMPCNSAAAAVGNFHSSSGLFRLPTEIHVEIASYLPIPDMYAMAIFMACRAATSVSDTNLGAYIEKQPTQHLLQLTLHHEYPYQFQMLLNQCSPSVLTSPDYLPWNSGWISSAGGRDDPANVRWLCTLRSELRYATLFPKNSPGIFANPINMAAATGIFFNA
jgi:hypothetical protein